MQNNNILKISIITIAIVLSSCTSFEQHRQFAYKVLDNPDSLISIYQNSEYFDSLTYKNNFIRYVDKYHILKIKRNFRDKQYIIFTEREDTRDYNQNDSSFSVVRYYLKFKSNISEYYIGFVFRKVDDKWILVSMPIDITP